MAIDNHHLRIHSETRTITERNDRLKSLMSSWHTPWRALRSWECWKSTWLHGWSQTPKQLVNSWWFILRGLYTCRGWTSTCHRVNYLINQQKNWTAPQMITTTCYHHNQHLQPGQWIGTDLSSIIKHHEKKKNTIHEPSLDILPIFNDHERASALPVIHLNSADLTQHRGRCGPKVLPLLPRKDTTGSSLV